MQSSAAIDLIASLGRRADRAAVVKALAAALGVEEMLLFVRDPALGVWLPAPGLPQTLRGGATWRAFLTRCDRDGRCDGEVELPIGVRRPAHALVHGSAVVVTLGGEPAAEALSEIEGVLPLISSLLTAEQDALLARAEAGIAKDAQLRAEELASALDRARAHAAQLNAELQDADRRKDEFLAMLGHELRNPLGPLTNSIELLRRAGVNHEFGPKALEVMSRQVRHLTRLVDDLLDASRVSRGRIELRRETLLLADLLHDAIEATHALISQRRHTLTLEETGEPLAVSGDRIRLMQVFGNLLNNAAKYTDAGGDITLQIGREGPNARVRLTDTGIGIEADMLPRVFDLFIQAPGALARAQGGLGIGLTLVRTLVELHGGRVSVESAGLGRGSTFTVTLPLVAAPRLAVKETHRETGAASEAPVRVLVVDDNRDAADAIALLLRDMGHAAEVAYSPGAALQLPARTHADLIFLDIGMPGMDGYELARELRASTKPGARFVALTGFGTPPAARRSIQAGFDQHLVKPVSAETLRRVVSEVRRQLVQTAS